MKALTVKQPWAWAIAEGYKPVENRTWPPPRYIIGQRIAIHASARIDKVELLAYEELGAGPSPRYDTLPTGCIVATAIVIGYCTDTAKVCLHDLRDSYDPHSDPWFCGPFGWLPSDVRKVIPIPCKGALGLWDVPKEYLPLLEAS